MNGLIFFLSGALLLTLNLGGAIYSIWKGDTTNALICLACVLLLGLAMSEELKRLL